MRTHTPRRLQIAATRRALDNRAREAFRFVTETIVEHFAARGYEVTGPDNRRTGLGPQPVFKTPPNARRQG